MRPWAWVRRVLALLVTVVFLLGAIASPADAKTKSRSFSSPKSSSSYSSGSSRSFSTPKPSTPKVTTPSTPSRSFSSPKPSTTTPSTPPRTFSSPAPSGTSTPSQSYSTPSQSYSSSDRGYTSEPRTFSSQRPSTTGPSTTAPSTPKVTPIPSTPPVTYDTGRTRYPSRPPVIVYAPGNFEPWYWHDYYYGRPWYWRAWHRPVYYGNAGGFAINWWPIIIVGGIGLWVLLAVLSARTTRRRR